MKHRSFVRGVRWALALSIMLASAAVAAPDKVLRDPASITPGEQNGQKGFWVEYTEYTFQHNAYIRDLAVAAGLNAADIAALLAWAHGLNPGPTDAQIAAKIAEIKAAYYSRDGVLARFWASVGGHISAGTYGEAGGYAYQLAVMLTQAGLGAPGEAVVMSDYTWAAEQRGWPLEAAMIHSPEYNTGVPLTQGTWLDAWDLVWGDLTARGISSLGDPIVLDLNHNGKIEVTGKSSAKFRAKANRDFVPLGAVRFDTLGTGKPVLTEWILPGEGLLVDNRKGAARKVLAQGKPLTVFNLFGDRDGYASGFFKLAALYGAKAQVASARTQLAPGALVIKGKQLDDLLVWVDNGDGKALASELVTLASLGITELRLPARFSMTPDKEVLEQASYVRRGQTQLMQEVWFAHKK